MARYARKNIVVQDNRGNVVPGASIEVRKEIAGLPLASIYSDRSGSTPMDNPFLADADGFAYFHAGGGAYQIIATSGGFQRTENYVALGNASEVDDVVNLSEEDQELAGGARVTPKDLGTMTTGTLTPDPGDRPIQYYSNNGTHTLAPGSHNGSYILDITNAASAGAITTSGWTKVTGDAFTTTNGHKFRCICSIGPAGSMMSVQALQ